MVLGQLENDCSRHSGYIYKMVQGKGFFVRKYLRAPPYQNLGYTTGPGDDGSSHRDTQKAHNFSLKYSKRKYSNLFRDGLVALFLAKSQDRPISSNIVLLLIYERQLKLYFRN